jgi:hypothetical protein
MEKIIQYLGWAVLALLALAIARQLAEQRTIYLLPDSFGTLFSRHGWDRGLLEAFTGAQADSVKGRVDTTGVVIPADATLNAPTQPYALLNGVLPEKLDKGTLTAKTCYDKDFLAQSNKVGNYIQRTNNFRHAAPDSCSAPLTELVNSFYLNP